MNFFSRKGFRRGDIASNGKERMIVNRVFVGKDNEERMLVADFLWGGVEYMVKYCEEVPCADWYKI